VGAAALGAQGGHSSNGHGEERVETFKIRQQSLQECADVAAALASQAHGVKQRRPAGTVWLRDSTLSGLG
jgi:hypothetical protein